MKKQHRAGCGDNTNAASFQDRFHVQSPSPDGSLPLINPSAAALRMKDAMDGFRASMDVAGSVAFLMASAIDHNSKSFGGWEIFRSHAGFVDGTYGIAEIASLRLAAAFTKFKQAYSTMLDTISKGRKVASVAVDLDTRDALLSTYKFNMQDAGGLEFERCVDVMADALEIMSITLSARNAQNGYVGEALALSAKNDLDSAFQEIWKSAENLRDAAVAVQCQHTSE